MTQWRAWGSSSGSVPQGTTQYAAIFGCNTVGSATEANHSAKAYSAYTFSNFRTKVTANSGTSAASFRFAGGNSTNLALSITTTGWQEDVTGVDTVAANDLVLFRTTAGGSHGNTVTCGVLIATYELASEAPLVGGGAGSTFLADRFWSLASAVGRLLTTEAESYYRAQRAHVFSNLRAQISTGAASGLVAAIGVNGVSSANVAISPTGTGAFEDTTGSESIAAADDVNFRMIRTANTWAITIFQAQANTATAISGTSAVSTSISATTRTYQNFAGLTGLTATDDNYTARMGSISVAKWQTYCSVAGSGTRDVTVRVASANSTNLTISITGTGYFEDVTGTDAVGDTDHLGWSLASTGTAVEIVRVALEAPWVAAAAPTGTGASTVDDLTSAGTGSVSITATGSSTVDDLTSAGTGAMAEAAAGTGASTVDDLMSSGTGSVTISGSGSSTIDDLTSEGTGSLTVAGTGASTVDDLISSGEGIMHPAGTGASTVDDLTSSGTGSVNLSGSGASTVDEPTSAGTGVLHPDGSGSSTIDDLTSAGTGVLAISGTGSSTVDDLESSGTGLQSFAGTGASTVDDLTSEGTGALTVTGTGESTIDDLTSDGTGSLAISGTGTSTIDDLTSEGTGDVSFGATGAGASTVDDLTSEGTGAVAIIGTGASSIDDPTSEGTGSLAISGTGESTVDDITSEGQGIHSLGIEATGSSTVDDLTSTGAGAVAISGSGSSDIDEVSSAGSGLLSAPGAGASTVDEPTSAGTGSVNLIGAGTSQLDEPTSSGAGAVSISGSGASTVPAASSEGTGQAGAVPVTGSGSSTVDDLTSSGTGTVTGGAQPSHPHFSSPAGPRTQGDAGRVLGYYVVEAALTFELIIETSLAPVAVIPASVTFTVTPSITFEPQVYDPTPDRLLGEIDDLESVLLGLRTTGKLYDELHALGVV